MKATNNISYGKRKPFHHKKNYRGITLTSIAAKIYNLMLLNRIRPKIDLILRKNQNGLQTNRSTTGQILIIRRILEGVKSKNLPLTLLFINFSKAFDTINRKKIDGTYTRMLRAVKNPGDDLTNEQLYGDIPKISKSICMQRFRFAGHCWKSKDEIASDLIFWQPTHGNRSRGRRM